MRQHKYRVYDSQNEKMVYGVGIDPNGFAYRIPEDATEDCTSFDYFPDDEVMEWTGLKDKNGAEIYEGDGLKREWQTLYDEYEDILVVELDQGCFRIKDDGSPLAEVYSECEVIGNVFQNPELLESAD